MENTISQENKKENFLSKINWKKFLEYSFPALITISIFLFAMLVKGVYPFGNDSFGYIDFHDGLVPSYTALWDVLHGKQGLFVTWNLGAGGSFFSSAVLNSFLSPISYLIALFPREYVIYSVVLVVIIMLALMATTAYLCFKKYFPNVDNKILLLFSLLWTFSGWTLVHYTNVGWLNLMVLFPLLLISAKTLFNEGKTFWFVIILSYMLMLSYYITYMVLVAVVIVATTYICIISKNKKKNASDLFFAIIISILISMVVFIPSCITSLQAHRFNGTVTANPKTELFDHAFSKLTVLIMYALPVVFFIKLLFTYKKDKKNVLFFLVCFIIIGAGLIIEPINQMWHTGSYFCFPYRYGFNMIMLLIFGSLYYINKNYSHHNILENEQEKPKTSLDYNYIIVLSTAIISLFFTFLNSIAFSHPYRPINILNFLMYLIPFISSFISITFALKLKKKKLSLGKIPGGIIIFVICLVQICSLTVGYCGWIGGTSKEKVFNSNNISVSQLESGYKIKDRENLYNYNFPLLIDYPSLTSWIHISSEEQYVGYNKLGYNTESTLLKSSGGTLLTDVLLGNKYVLSKTQLNPAYYTLINTFDYKNENENEKVNLYEMNFNFDLVFTTNTDLSSLIKNNNDWFNNHNTLFKNLYSQTENIISTVDCSITEEEKDYYLITINNIPDHNLYMSNKFVNSFNIKQNNYEFDAYNGLVDLGINATSSLQITINIKNTNIAEIKENISFGCFDVEKFAQINNSYSSNNSKLKFNGNSIHVEVDNKNQDRYVLIPYTNMKNMSSTINSKQTETLVALDTFIMLKLEEGMNNINITYKPQLLKLCFIITIIAITIFITLSILNKHFNLSNNKVIICIGFGGACLILLVVGFLVYLKPLFRFFTILFT